MRPARNVGLLRCKAMSQVPRRRSRCQASVEQRHERTGGPLRATILAGRFGRMSQATIAAGACDEYGSHDLLTSRLPRALSSFVAYWTTPRPVLEIPIGTANGGVPQFSPDGLLLAVPRYEGGVGIFRVADGTLVRKLPGRSLRCAWKFDGSRLAVAQQLAGY